MDSLYENKKKDIKWKLAQMKNPEEKLQYLTNELLDFSERNKGPEADPIISWFNVLIENTRLEIQSVVNEHKENRDNDDENRDK